MGFCNYVYITNFYYSDHPNQSITEIHDYYLPCYREHEKADQADHADRADHSVLNDLIRFFLFHEKADQSNDQQTFKNNENADQSYSYDCCAMQLSA